MLISRIKESALVTKSYLLRQRWSQPRDLPCVVIFTSQIHTGSAGDLRARAIGRELRRMGWRAIVVPPQLALRARERLIADEHPDVIFLQQSWHPLNRPGFYPGIPCVFDADDANFHDSPELVAECCGRSRATIAGSHYIADFFRRHNPDVTVIWTGTYLLPSPKMIPNAQRSPVITWAQSDPSGFPEEAAFVREVILRLSGKAKFSFYLYGVRDYAAAQEYLAPIRAAGVDTQLIMFMRYRNFGRSLEEAAIGLQPVCCAYSRGKNFGKLLAYMVSGVAAVAANAFEYPFFFRHGQNGMLAADVDEWVGCCRFLLDNPEERGQIANQAYLDFQSRLTTRRAAELVSEVLHRVVGDSRHTDGQARLP
jgi:hypothetical protein